MAEGTIEFKGQMREFRRLYEELTKSDSLGIHRDLTGLVVKNGNEFKFTDAYHERYSREEGIDKLKQYVSDLRDRIKSERTNTIPDEIKTILRQEDI